MKGDNIHLETTPAYQKTKAENALKAAKKLEAKQLKAGKKFVHLNHKTIALR